MLSRVNLISKRGLFYLSNSNTTPLYNLSIRNYTKHDPLDLEEPKKSNTTDNKNQPREGNNNNNNYNNNYKPREYNQTYQKPYQQRDGNQNQQRGEYKPREGNDQYQQRPPYQQRGDYKPREGNDQNQQRTPYQQRDEYKPREGNDQNQQRPPYQQRGDYKPREGNDQYQQRQSNQQRGEYKPREGNDQYQQRQPYQQRDDNRNQQSSPYQQRGEYKPREGNDQNQQRQPYQQRGDYKPREGNDQNYKQRDDQKRQRGDSSISESMSEQIARLHKIEMEKNKPLQEKKLSKGIHIKQSFEDTENDTHIKEDDEENDRVEEEEMDDDDENELSESLDRELMESEEKILREQRREERLERLEMERRELEYGGERRRDDGDRDYYDPDREDQEEEDEEKLNDPTGGFTVRGMQRDKQRERLIRNSRKRRGEKETAYSILLQEKMEEEENKVDEVQRINSIKDLKLKIEREMEENEGIFNPAEDYKKTWPYFLRTLKISPNPIYSDYTVTKENPPIALRLYDIDSTKKTQTYYNNDLLEFDKILVINEENKLIGPISGAEAIRLAKEAKMDIVVKTVRDDDKSIARMVKMDQYCSEIETKTRKTEIEDLERITNVSFLKEKTITISHVATETHIQDKVKQAEKLINKSHPVKIVLSIKNSKNEPIHTPEEIIKKIIEQLKPIARYSSKEVRARLISVIFTPKKVDQERVDKQREKYKKLVGSKINKEKSLADILKENLIKDIKLNNRGSSFLDEEDKVDFDNEERGKYNDYEDESEEGDESEDEDDEDGDFEDEDEYTRSQLADLRSPKPFNFKK